MEDVRTKINKSSHSGAVMDVVKEGNRTFVYKRITEDIPRTIKSLEKQKAFSVMETVEYRIHTPPLQYWEESGKLIAKMPYIEGISGAYISSHGSKVLARNIRLSLNNYFIDLIAKSQEVEIPSRIIQKKLNDIQARSYPSEVYARLSEAIDWIECNIGNTLNLPMGSCHGDLTLSNMIITQSHELYFLDFLDSYLESPLQDVAKIYQDLVYGWSFRRESSALRLRSQLFCDGAFPDYLNIIKRIYCKEVPIFNLMTILRIAPYISKTDRSTIEWFNRTIQRMLASV